MQYNMTGVIREGSCLEGAVFRKSQRKLIGVNIVIETLIELNPLSINLFISH
jgi:hypothetical protein